MQSSLTALRCAFMFAILWFANGCQTGSMHYQTELKTSPEARPEITPTPSSAVVSSAVQDNSNTPALTSPPPTATTTSNATQTESIPQKPPIDTAAQKISTPPPPASQLTPPPAVQPNLPSMATPPAPTQSLPDSPRPPSMSPQESAQPPPSSPPSQPPPKLNPPVNAPEMAALTTPIPTQSSQPPPVMAEKVKPQPPPTGNLSASVKITANGETISPDGVIVVLEPLDSSLIPHRESKQHVIDMVGKKYTPRNTLIRVGDTVIFKNLDPFKHNVFSSTPGNKFDLGTYGRGTEPAHVFNEPGAIKVYCNIHPDMSAIIMVGNSDWGSILGPEGIMNIENLPAGEYRTTAWSIRGESSANVTINPGKDSELKLTIDATSFKPVPHLNKLGKKYPTTQSDEFY